MNPLPSLIDVDAKFPSGSHRRCPLLEGRRSTFPHSRYRHCLQDQARIHHDEFAFTGSEFQASYLRSHRLCRLCGSRFETDVYHSLVCTGCKAVVSKSSKTLSGVLSREEGIFHGSYQEWVELGRPRCEVCDCALAVDAQPHPVEGLICDGCLDYRMSVVEDVTERNARVVVQMVFMEKVAPEIHKHWIDPSLSLRRLCFDEMVLMLAFKITRSRVCRPSIDIDSKQAAKAPLESFHIDEELLHQVPEEYGILCCSCRNYVVVAESGPHWPTSAKMPCGCNPAFPGDHLIDPLFTVLREGKRWRSKRYVYTDEEALEVFGTNPCMAAKKRRGVRAGKRVKARSDGYCYTKLVTRKHREDLTSLGVKPTIDELATALEGKAVTTVPKALVLRKGGYHVVAKNFDMYGQMSYLLEHHPKRRVGAETWDEQDLEEAAEMYLAYVFRKELDEEDDEQKEQEEVPIKIKGQGDCWRKLPFVGHNKWFDQCGRLDMTIEDILDEVEAYLIKMRGGLEIIDAGGKPFWRYLERELGSWSCIWEVQDDGDLHVEEVKTAFGDGGLYRFVKHLYGMHRKGELTRLVGKAATAAVDEAMRTLNNPTVQMNLQNAVSAKVTDALSRNNKICPWAIKAENQHHANELNIPWSCTNADKHDHPIHAAIRRMQCYEELPKHVKSDFTTISMNEANWKMLDTGLRAKGKHYTSKHQNPIIDHKDHGRYAGTNSVPKSVFSLEEVDTPTVLFHDSGHYLTAGFLWDFFYKNPKVMYVYVTHVYPLVSLIADTSPDPTLYQFEYSSDRKTIVYVPEGHLGGKYEQPADPGILLARNISDKYGLMSIHGSIIDSRLNSHIQCWSRFQAVVPRFVALSMPDMMPIPRVKRGMPGVLPLVKTEYYTKLFQYAKTLNMKDTDAWGKVRQFTVEQHMYFPVGVQAQLIDSVMEAVKIPVTPDLQPKYYGSVMEMVKYKTIGHLIRMKHKLIDRPYADRALTLINEPYPLHLLPTIDVLIDRKGQFEYGVEWVIPPEERKRFFMSLKRFIGWWRKDAGVTERNIMNHEGFVVWDETITLTSRTEQCFGIDIIKTVQARTYQKVFEGNTWKPPRGVARGPPPELKMPRKEDDPYYQVDSETSSDDTDDLIEKYEAESDTSEEEDGLEAGWFDPAGHCATGAEDGCPLWLEFNSRYPHLTKSEYNEFTYAHHKLAESEKRDDERNRVMAMVERSIARREVKKSEESETMPHMFGKSLPVITELPEPDDVFVKTYKEVCRDVLRDPGCIQIPPQPERYKPRPFKWEDANREWEKIQNERRVVPYVAQGTGVALWDNLFPKTVDKRIDAVPFCNPLVYPKVIYPRGDCLLVALSQLMGKRPTELLLAASQAMEKQDTEGVILGAGILDTLGCHYLCMFEVYDNQKNLQQQNGVKIGPVFQLEWTKDPYHFRPIGVKSRDLIIKNPRPAANAPPELQAMIDELTMLPAINWSSWTPSPTRAGQFVRAMIEKTTGTLAMAEFNTEMLKGWENTCEMLKTTESDRKIAVVVGSPGCRKSSPIQKICSQKKYHRNNLFTVTMATNTLAVDWRDKIGVRDRDPVTNRPTPGRYVCTYERCLADGNWGWVMIFDEDKYPKGYFDLCAALFPWVKHFIFLCDPYQTEWHEPNTACQLNDPSILGNAAFLFPHAGNYLYGTWRLPKEIANFFRLPTWNRSQGSFHFADTPLHEWKDLEPFFGMRYDQAGLQQLWKRRMTFVASHASKQWMDALSDGDTVTFAGTQGLSVELAIIEVDIRVLRMSDARMMFTAMTRAREVIIVCTFLDDGMTKAVIEAHPIFSQLFKYRENYRPGHVVRINSEWTVDMFKHVKELPESLQVTLAGPPSRMENIEFVKKWLPKGAADNWIDPDRIKGGARLDVESDVYRNAPDFKPYIIGHQWVQPAESAPREGQTRKTKLKTHLPQVNESELIEANDVDVLDRYDRELSYKGIFSRQAPDGNVPFFDEGKRRLEWMKKQRDDVSLRGLTRRQKDAVVMSRMREGLAEVETHFKPKALNWGLDQRADDGPSFAAGVNQRIRRKTYIENKREVEENIGYGLAMWDALKKYFGWNDKVPWDERLYEDCEILFQMRRAERSDDLKKMSLNRASPDYQDFLTAKTQWKLKSRVSKPASPLQTILVRSDRVLFRDGPLGIYLLEMIERNCPRYVYLHARKTFAQMGDWIAAQPEPDMYEMCDIEGFDSSIRGGDVTLEQCMMRHFGVPEQHIDEYTEDKMDFHTRTIHFGIMRFSGEIFTWLFNTMHTLARECLKYDHIPGDQIACSGDDVLKWVTRPESTAWWRWKLSDPSVEKRYRDRRGEFCSFIVYGREIFKDPVILYRRLKGQIERGRVDEVALGYFEMFAVQYELADKLYDLMDEEELQYCAAINRIMFNWKKVTGSRVALPWSKVHVDYVDGAAGTRDEAIEILERFYEMRDPVLEEPLFSVDIVATAMPSVSFQHIWGMDSLDD